MMDSPYSKICTDICDFNHMVERIEDLVQDIKEIKKRKINN